MTAPTCSKCGDTGSLSGDIDGFLDCVSCDAAQRRNEMRNYLQGLSPLMHAESEAWAAYQFALSRSVAAQPSEVVQPVPELREVLRDALASGLAQTYGCSRTWNAWNVGTMTEEDFYPVDECDEILDDLCDLAIDALGPFADPIAAPIAAVSAAPSGEVEEQLRGEGWLRAMSDVSALLPCSYYMDPPDGGSVTVIEQVERMAKDAARYRWLSMSSVGQWMHPIVVEPLRDRKFNRINYIGPLSGCVLDAAIDAAIATGEKK